jgi:hypothetical protein
LGKETVMDSYDYDYDTYANDAEDLYIDDDYDMEEEDDRDIWDNYYHNITDELVDE